jgi:hypothetical protein
MTINTICKAPMTRLGVTPDRNGLANPVERLRCAAVAFVECMEPEVARRPASITEIIGMACAQKR